MSLADERARDVEEIIEDEPIEFRWHDAWYSGKKTAAVPDALGMLDAGYERESDIGLLVMASQFIVGDISLGNPSALDTVEVATDPERQHLTSYKIMKVNTTPGYFQFELKELK